MLRLQALGGLTLLDAAGTPLVTQRRRLGLLALLAAAGGRGSSRDKLVAYLWAESSTEHARHALEQLLYSIRRQISDDALLGTDPLQLNPSVLTSDVGDFERALARDDLAEAAALYHGPFLDGFFLSDAPAFEVWAESERSRLATAYEGALFRLAREAGGRGQHTTEIDWWRRLATLDPLSERSALGLARALAGAGDWAGALHHAEVYESLVREELAMPPTPELTAFVQRIRTGDDAPSKGRKDAGSVPAERYRIERELGRGTMATVYLARDLKHNRPVALKVLRPELATSTEAKRFLREIAIVAGLHHPHILQLYDSGALEAPGRCPSLYYVMPVAGGESVRERLVKEEQLPLGDALRIAREVADALAYAHAHGIVHRDVRPENLLLESGHALVADFGIAHALDLAGGERLSLTGVMLGNPSYMSPEQAAATGGIDGRSDIYSLGCVLYEMLAGEPPFSGRTSQAILARHAADPVPSLRTVRPDVPAALERAVERALAKAPADRFPSAREFAEALGLA
ncbi:MAG TPA: protein kinase [Gemmatimonadales bacterium]|nr:protein kinase [Gemmatimonadales bacterium]